MTNRFVYTPEDTAGLILERAVNKYSPDQPRDERGQFSFSNADMSATETSLRGGDRVSVSPKDALKLVREIGSYEVANGERNTPIDLNQIHIKGTNLFDSKNLGIPRSQMPQIPEKLRPEFEQYLKDSQITFQSEIVDPRSLTPSQSQLSLNGSFLKIGEILAQTPVADLIVSKDNYVLDGHHRWAGAVLASFEDPSVQLNVMRLNVDHNEALQTMYNFNHDYAVAGQAHGVVRKYSVDQPRDENGRFTEVSGDPSNLRVGVQQFDPEDAPLAVPDWANRNTRIDWREPHIGLSDKAKEVASRIGVSTPPKIVEDRVRGQLIESGKSTSAIYITPKGDEIKLVYERWSPMQNGAERTNGSVDAYSDGKRIGGFQFDNKNYFYNEDKNGNISANSYFGQKSSFAEITHIEVYPKYQREGIATAMLEFARRETPDLGIVHSTRLTDEGRTFASITKYSPDQERDENGRFASGSLALPSWANQDTLIDLREPHIGLSDKAKEVALRISPNTDSKYSEDRNKKGDLIEYSYRATAVYTAPDGEDYKLNYERWSYQGTANLQGMQHEITVEVKSDDKFVGSLNVSNGNQVTNSFAEIDEISVNNNYQRQGIATAMLEFARRETPDLGIVHSKNLTSEGRAFSEITKYAPNALYSNLDGSCIVFDYLDGNNIYGRIVQNGVESEPQELDTILAQGDWQPIYPEDDVVKSLIQDLEKFSPDQPRDDHGRFSFVDDTAGGGGSSEPKNLVTVNDKNITKKLMDGSIDNLTVSQLAGDPIPITDILKPGTNFSIAEMGQIAITGLLTRREDVNAESLKYADKQLQAMLDKSTPSIQMTSDALEEILNQDRFLTLEELGSTVQAFTTGNNDNEEDWYRGVRLMAENLWFNYDNNTNPGERPVYGYMRPNNTLKATDEAFKAYGDIRVELNRDVLDRTTISIGDSLNNTDIATPFQYGSSLASSGFPQYRAIEQNDYYDDGANGNYFSSKDFQNNFSYVEAQFHGGLDTADIAKVYLPEADEDLQARLDDAGIAWKVGRK